jgi:hypothetical protein
MGTKKGDRDPPFSRAPTARIKPVSPARSGGRSSRSGLALIGVTLRILVHQLDDLVDKEHDDDDSNNHTDDRADGNGINIHLILLSAA